MVHAAGAELVADTVGGCEPEVSEREAETAVEAQDILRLQIAVDVSQTMQLVDGHEHFAGVEENVPHGKNGASCVVEERAEVASRDVFHG